MCLLSWLVMAHLVCNGLAGWSSQKGRGGHSRAWSSSNHGDWYGYRQGKGQTGGFYSNPHRESESLALHLLDKLCRSDSTSRDRIRRERSRDRRSDRSCSREKEDRHVAELRELRAYREHHEAMEKAKAEKERQDTENKKREQELADLEARILRCIPTQVSPTPVAKAQDTGKSDVLPAKTKKLVEALLEDEVCCENVSSWDDVECKVKSLAGSVLSSIHRVRMPEISVPRTNSAKAAAILAHVKTQARVWNAQELAAVTSPRIDFPRLHGPIVGFSPLFVVVVFVFGFWFGACVNPWPGAGGSFMPSIVQYVWAIKLIAWDFRYLSHLLETWTGAPILTGASGVSYICCIGLGYLISFPTGGHRLQSLHRAISGKLVKSVLNHWLSFFPLRTRCFSHFIWPWPPHSVFQPDMPFWLWWVFVSVCFLACIDGFKTLLWKTVI